MDTGGRTDRIRSDEKTNMKLYRRRGVGCVSAGPSLSCWHDCRTQNSEKRTEERKGKDGNTDVEESMDPGHPSGFVSRGYEMTSLYENGIACNNTKDDRRKQTVLKLPK